MRIAGHSNIAKTVAVIIFSTPQGNWESILKPCFSLKIYMGFWESSILAASIEDKISLYQTVYLTALKQTENDLPYNISLQACSFYQPSITAICNRQNLAETINEYSEEIETWLDIQFADEYDDFTSQPDFDPITELMVALEMLTALLSGGREKFIIKPLSSRLIRFTNFQKIIKPLFRQMSILLKKRLSYLNTLLPICFPPPLSYST